MGAPIRTSTEIQMIINKAQHALADLGLEIVKEKKRGKTTTNRDHRDKVYRLILIRAYLQNILLPDGTFLAYYEASANEKKFNKILNGLVNLAKGFDGPSIPLMGRRNIPILFFPGTSGNSSTIGGGPATPGGTAFQAIATTPSTLIDTFDASISSFAFYIVSVVGSNSGEGSRTSLMAATWRGSNAPVSNEIKTEDVGGITSPVTLRIELVAGKIQLNAYVTTNNWTITGVRILFQNISFVNPVGPLPAGGTTGQFIRKASNNDYDVMWATLTAAMISDLLASATELNFSQGVTSSIQTQLNTLTTALGNYLLKSGGTMTGVIAMGNHKITGLSAGTTNGDALRYEQLVGVYLLLAGGTMSGPIAMGGSKITGLGAASANGEAVRYEQLSGHTFTTITIGDWNILVSNLLTIAHGLADYKKIRGFKVIIRDDTDTIYQLNASAGTLNYVDGANVHLIVDSAFQTTAYDSTGFNRGWITFEIAP